MLSQSEKLDKLIGFALDDCPLVTDNIFPFTARMVSLRVVVIQGCVNVRFQEHVTELDNLRRVQERSLKF